MNTKLIGELIANGVPVADAIAIAKGQSPTPSPASSSVETAIPVRMVPLASIGTPEVVEHIRSRRLRRNGPRVVYQLTAMAKALANGKGTPEEKRAVTNLFPSAADCLKVIAQSKTPMSNHDIEKASGHKQKTVESCVYALRHAGLIESVQLADELVGDEQSKLDAVFGTQTPEPTPEPKAKRKYTRRVKRTRKGK